MFTPEREVWIEPYKLEVRLFFLFFLVTFASSSRRSVSVVPFPSCRLCRAVPSLVSFPSCTFPADLHFPSQVDYPFFGASPLFPYVSCQRTHEVCIVTTGEGEINAAATMMALSLSSLFDLTETYFLIAGIGGVNPYHGTLGTAAFASYSVQVGLSYELDARQMPANWTTGYWVRLPPFSALSLRLVFFLTSSLLQALGTSQPGELPDVSDLYGT
jgi:hypothetical protein